MASWLLIFVCPKCPYREQQAPSQGYAPSCSSQGSRESHTRQCRPWTMQLPRFKKQKATIAPISKPNFEKQTHHHPAKGGISWGISVALSWDYTITQQCVPLGKHTRLTRPSDGRHCYYLGTPVHTAASSTRAHGTEGLQKCRPR